MGTETRNNSFSLSFLALAFVKLNNPLMGTENIL